MSARTDLVKALCARGAIRTDGVTRAFAEVPRELFIPELRAREGLAAVYRDEAVVTRRDPLGIPISSSSQPSLMAQMLELLEVGQGHHVLEIGAGTGYNAALLRHIVGPRGQVTTVDIDPAIAGAARVALRRAGSRARVVAGDGRAGWRRGAPYDRIIVTACADALPRAWLDQLREGGRVIVPLRLDPDGAAIQLIPVLERAGERLRSDGLTWGGFMALHDGGGGGWEPPPHRLEASRSSGGVHRSLAALSGAGLTGLTADAAAARLAELVTGRGARRAFGRTAMASGSAPLLIVYLLLEIPARRRVSVVTSQRLGVGVVHARTGSLAVLTVPNPWSRKSGANGRRVGWRLDAYGGIAASVELETLLARWRELEAVTTPTLTLTASGVAGVDPLRLRFRWR